MTPVTWLPRHTLPEDPMEGLRVLVEEYGAASARDRNYGSSSYAHLFWSYLTDLMPLLLQRREDQLAALGAQIAQIQARTAGDPLPRPDLRVVR